MAKPDDQSITIIRKFLSELKEGDLYEPLCNLLLARGYHTWIVHGPHERGRDIIATKANQHNLLVSVKTGDIDQKRWNTDIYASLNQLIIRQINHTEVNEKLPRKHLLIFNGLMSTPVDQLMDDLNKHYQNTNVPMIEVWDINRLSIEFNEYLMSSELLAKSYLEDIDRLILSITEESIDYNLAVEFIDKYVCSPHNLSHFMLATLYVLRRSENKRNLYSFFKFAESALVKLWNRIYAEKDLSIVTKFDELHDIYFNSLKKWIESLNGLISQENGLADLSHGGLSEIISYPLRSFDVVRRISYAAYVCFLLKQYDQAREYVKLLIKVVKNNKAANTPLCEFNYNDIGLALTVMHWAREDAEAVEWLFSITDFLISHYKSGYELMPLGDPLEKTFQAIFGKRQANTHSKSHIFPLIFEFAIIINAYDLYNTFISRIPSSTMFCELVMPKEQYEEEIYNKEFLQATEIKIPYHGFNWNQWKLMYNTRIKTWQRNYTPMHHKRPYVLVLISNIYRDRYFPDIWRNVTIEA